MANRYFLNIGANTNDTANWSDTNGGTGGFSVPTSVDDVFFTASSGNATFNAAHTWKSVTCTGYTGTWTMSNSLSVAGSVTLVAAMTITGSGNLTVTAGGTFTSNGKTWPNSLTVGATGTVLADTLTVTGSLTLSTNSSVMQGQTVNVGGSFTQSATINSANQTTKIVLNGTGTVSGSGYIGNDLEVNTSGTITFSGTINLGNSSRTVTLKRTAGTTVTTSSTLNLGAACIFDTNGVTWNNITQASFTITNNSALTVSGTYSISTGNINGSDVNLTGNLTLTGNNSGSPTAKFVFNGTGSQAISGNFNFSNNIDVNKSSGTLTIGSFGYRTGTFNYIAGSTSTTGSTFTIAGACTLNTNGITFDAVSVGTTGTITINSLLSGSTLTLPNTNATFAGTAGFTFATIQNTTPTAARVWTLKNGVTYTITAAANLIATNSFNCTLQSSTTSYANFVVQSGATQNMQYIKATYIDSSAGQTVRSQNIRPQDLSNTLNWSAFSGGYFRFF